MAEFNVEAAKKAGYSEDEILSHLTQTRKFDIAAAEKAGYSKVDIISHLSKKEAPSLLRQAAQIPFDALQGIGAGVMSTGANAYELARKIPGAESVLPPVSDTVRGWMQAPDSFSAKAGKFAEQAAELLVPATKVANITKGMGLAAKVAGQAATGAGVTAIQSKGDPASTVTSAALGAAGPLIGAGARAIASGKLPENLYQSALKPTWNMFKAEGTQMIKTGLAEGIPVSHEGMNMLESRINSVGKEITQGITENAAQGRVVDTSKVVKTLDGLWDYFANTPTPKEHLQRIADTLSEFEQFHGQSIPLDKAQAMKVNTYKLLQDAYGEMKTAKIESLKQIGRGLKEEISKVWPEISDLNERQSKMLGFNDALYRALFRIDSHQMMGIGSGIAGAAGGALLGATGAGIGLISKLLLDNPTLKSKIGIALYQAGVKSPGAALESGLKALKASAQEAVTRPSGPSAQTAMPQLAPAQ